MLKLNPPPTCFSCIRSLNLAFRLSNTSISRMVSANSSSIESSPRSLPSRLGLLGLRLGLLLPLPLSFSLSSSPPLSWILSNSRRRRSFCRLCKSSSFRWERTSEVISARRRCESARSLADAKAESCLMCIDRKAKV